MNTASLIELLERKNTCYRSFHRLCSDFLDQISQNLVEGLEQFQNRRQSLAKVLEQLEAEVRTWLDHHGSESQSQQTVMDAPTRVAIASAVREKEALILGILDLDREILTHIERIKAETYQKLHALNQARTGIGKYRSPLESIESAEGSNNLVDHKA